jgi:hypothetical protein
MPNFAIIIGIDSYANPAWNLSAAVPDALNFLEWAHGPGSVPADETHTRLLLSSAEPNVTSFPHEPATSDNIVKAINAFKRGAGEGGDRLYFYYAGHGVSAPGAKRDGLSEPVIIPSDVASLEDHVKRLIAFSEIMPALSSVSPREQFFFIDACRDFAIENFTSTISPSSIRWRPPLTEGGQNSAQFVLYATSLGQQAYETGQGAFGRALVAGLEGEGAAIAWLQLPPRYEIRFSKLVQFVRTRVDAAIKQIAQKDAARYMQVPEVEIIGGSGGTDPVLREIEPADVKNVSVKVRVTPKEAREKGRVRVIQSLAGGKEVELAIQPPPPLTLPATFELAPADYIFAADADQYEERRQVYAAYEPTVLDFKLAQTAALPTAPMRGTSVAVGTSVAEGPTGTLEVFSADRSVVIIVRDSQLQVVPNGVGMGEIRLKSLVPGIYRVQPVVPDGPIQEKIVEVRANEVMSVPLTVESTRIQLGTRQEEMLSARGISPSVDGYVSPAELLGPIADAKLASLLGFAAFAVHWPGAHDFQRLRSFGVTPMQNVAPGVAGLLILIGAAGDQPVPELDPEQFLAAGQLIAKNLVGEVIDKGGFEPLAGFAAAAQRQTRIPVGPLEVELRLPRLAPTHYALVGLPDRVTVLVLVAEDGGGFEVQQYLIPLPRPVLPAEEALLTDPANIRRLEVAQRYYATGLEIPVEDNLDGLLYGKWLDPLLGCVAGYSLIRQGMAARYVGQPNPGAGATTLEASAMRNMLKFFGDLPDSHVLAGLVEPQNRVEHYTNALRHGLPLFADGFRALYTWYQTEVGELPDILATVGSGLLPASVWTAWTQVLRFSDDSGLPLELQQELQKTVASFVEYLSNIGFLPPMEPVGVDGSKEEPDNASYDPAANLIRIGPALARDPDVALREFTHHQLLSMAPKGVEFRDLSPAGMSIESGLADYYPCSFTDDPRVAESWAPTALNKPEVRNLDNMLSFFALTSEQRAISQVVGEVWGGAFWELRTLLGQERTDRLLLAAWSAQEKPDLKQLKPADFVQRLLTSLAADGGPDMADQVRELFIRRELPLGT